MGSRGYQCPRYGAVRAWNEGFHKCSTTNDLHLSWDVAYEPGVLRADGFRDGGLGGVGGVCTNGKMAGEAADGVRTAQ